ncbi:uncharacterized protein [Narcine bancroftii]|uniref:uncharacterized protein n=1 Tax=Narcine bancroftii TaxID=1343680 RepID=UPI0038321EEC
MGKRKHQRTVKKLHFLKLSEPTCLQEARTQRRMDPEEDVQNSALKLSFIPVRHSECRIQQISKQRAGRVPVFHTMATVSAVTETLTVESAGAPPAGELKSCHSTATVVELQNASSITTVFPDIDSVKMIKEIWLKDNHDHQSPGIAGETLRGIFIRSQTARKDTKLREETEDPMVSKEQQDPIMPESTSVEMSVKDLEGTCPRLRIRRERLEVGTSSNSQDSLVPMWYFSLHRLQLPGVSPAILVPSAPALRPFLLQDSMKWFHPAISLKVILFLTNGGSSGITLPPLTECLTTRVGAPQLIQLDSQTTGGWSVEEASDIREEALRTNDGRKRARALLLELDTAVRTKEKGWSHIQRIKPATEPQNNNIDNLPSTWRAVPLPSDLKVTLRREKVP